MIKTLRIARIGAKQKILLKKQRISWFNCWVLISREFNTPLKQKNFKSVHGFHCINHILAISNEFCIT